MSELFRREVIETLAAPPVGRIVLHRNLPMWGMTLFAVAILAIVVAVLAGVTYTRHEIVSGVLVTRDESVQVTAPAAGVMVHANFADGAVVHRGDTLFSFSASKMTTQGVSPNSEIESTIRARMSSLGEELDTAQKLSMAEIASTRVELLSLQEQLPELESQHQSLQSRLKSQEDQATAHARLADAGFESMQMAQQKVDDLTEIKIRVAENLRQMSAIRTQIAEKRDLIRQYQLRQPGEKAQINRQLLDAQSQLVAQQASAQWSVVAPIDGILTNTNIAMGQDTQSGNLLVEIVPANTILQASVYPSSKYIGFMHASEKVKLRVDSYPYMKYGTLDGTVSRISPTPQRLGALANSTAKLAAVPSLNGEPVYPMQIVLGQQTLKYGNDRFELRAGMQVEADVQLEMRTLFEWLFDPLQAGKQ